MIKEGYPKLAKYTGNGHNYYVPTRASLYSAKYRYLNTDDLIILVADRYSNHIRQNCYYFVPLASLIKQEIPLSSICNWKARYTYLPSTFYVEILDNAAVAQMMQAHD